MTIIAGKGDRIADPIKQSRRLHEALPQSRLESGGGAGHMIHHTGLERVVAAIENSAGHLTVTSKTSAMLKGRRRIPLPCLAIRN